MPLFQRYHNLSRRIPKKGQKVTLYKRGSWTNQQYRRVSDGLYIFQEERPNGTLVFEKHLTIKKHGVGNYEIQVDEDLHLVNPSETDFYQWLAEPPSKYEDRSLQQKRGIASVIAIVTLLIIYAIYTLFQ